MIQQMSTTYAKLNPRRDISALLILFNQVNIKVPVKTAIEDNNYNKNDMRVRAGTRQK